MSLEITTAATFPQTGTGYLWSAPENICAADGSSAMYEIDYSGVTSPLYATNFGFAIPNATIKGIQVEMYRKSSNLELAKDCTVYLYYGGNQGDNQSDGTWWHIDYLSKTWGAANSVWGYAGINNAIVNNPNFGVAFVAENVSIGAKPLVYVDYVKMTITYERILRPSIFMF